MGVRSQIKLTVEKQAMKGKEKTIKMATRVTNRALQKVDKARARALVVKDVIDEKLLNSEGFQTLRNQVLEKTKKFEKETQLATNLALQILDRAKTIRQKLDIPTVVRSGLKNTRFEAAKPEARRRTSSYVAQAEGKANKEDGVFETASRQRRRKSKKSPNVEVKKS